MDESNDLFIPAIKLGSIEMGWAPWAGDDPILVARGDGADKLLEILTGLKPDPLDENSQAFCQTIEPGEREYIIHVLDALISLISVPVGLVQLPLWVE